MTGQPAEWKMVFVNVIPIKGLISELYKELIHSTHTHTNKTKHPNNLILKVGRGQ